MIEFILGAIFVLVYASASILGAMIAFQTTTDQANITGNDFIDAMLWTILWPIGWPIIWIAFAIRSHRR